MSRLASRSQWALAILLLSGAYIACSDDRSFTPSIVTPSKECSSSCKGCCLEGECVPSSHSACGIDGETCQVCLFAETCAQGICVATNPACADGGTNACGGCGRLPGIPGKDCGTCGKWQCSGQEVVCLEGSCDGGQGGNDGGASDGGADDPDGGMPAGDAGSGTDGGNGGDGGQGTGDGGTVGDGGPGGTDGGCPNRNACGGCSVLPGTPGDPCGACGTLVCADGGLLCSGDTLNACGGCGPLGHNVGESCSACGDTYQCNGRTLQCTGGNMNVCGGCGPLAGTPGTSCGSCGGTWQCGGTNAVCSAPNNACGGCGSLPGSPGGSCGCNGTYACSGTNLICNTRCGSGAVCLSGTCYDTCDNGSDCTTGCCARSNTGVLICSSPTYCVGRGSSCDEDTDCNASTCNGYGAYCRNDHTCQCGCTSNSQCSSGCCYPAGSTSHWVCAMADQCECGGNFNVSCGNGQSCAEHSSCVNNGTSCSCASGYLSYSCDGVRCTELAGGCAGGDWFCGK